MTTIRLWLDDIRPMPDGYTVHARTAAEAIELLKGGNVTLISFDHDLGDVPVAQADGYAPSEATGYTVAMWIEAQAFENPDFVVPAYTIHSANPIGAKNIHICMEMAQRYANFHIIGREDSHDRLDERN